MSMSSSPYRRKKERAGEPLVRLCMYKSSEVSLPPFFYQAYLYRKMGNIFFVKPFLACVGILLVKKRGGAFFVNLDIVLDIMLACKDVNVQICDFKHVTSNLLHDLFNCIFIHLCMIF